VEECTYFWGVKSSWGINTAEKQRPLNQEDNQAPQPSIKRNNVPFGLPNQWGLSHQIWSHPPMEGIGHIESDGFARYGNERNGHLQYVGVRKRKGYL
jgi:hypothetical protein